MEKRTKLWRRKYIFRVFKARMIYHLSFKLWRQDSDGNLLHWHELAKKPWAQKYRTIATVCSCEICHGARYDRVKYKRDTRCIIKESMD